MDLNTWLIYLIAAVGLSLSPGPNGLLALTHGALHGRRLTLFTIAGGALGFVVLIALSMFGIGALLQTSLLWLTVLLEPGRTFNLVVINALRATGDARFPVAAGALSMIVVLAGGSWWLGVHLGYGLAGVWIAYAADEWLRGLTMAARWYRHGWVRHARATHRRVLRKRLGPA